MPELYYLDPIDNLYKKLTQGPHTHDFVLDTGDIVYGNVITRSSSSNRYGTLIGSTGHPYHYSIIQRSDGMPYLILGGNGDPHAYLTSYSDIHIRPNNDNGRELNFSANGKLYVRNEFRVKSILRGIYGNRAMVLLHNGRDSFIVYSHPGHQWGSTPGDYTSDRPFIVTGGGYDTQYTNWTWFLGMREYTGYQRGIGVASDGGVSSHGIHFYTTSGSYIRVDGTAKLVRSTSSIRDKRQIAFLTNPKPDLVASDRSATVVEPVDTEKLLNVSAATFRSDLPLDSDRIRVGFIAENVEDNVPWAVSGWDGTAADSKYPDLPAINAGILALIQKRVQKLDELERRLEELEQNNG